MFCNIGDVRVSGCRDIDVMYKYPIGLTDKRFKVIKKVIKNVRSVLFLQL